MSNYPKIPEHPNDAKKQNFLTNLLQRKEFYQYKNNPKLRFRDPNDFDPLRGSFLKIQSHQLFCSNLVNPNTPYNRTFVMHQTGTGKTLVALTLSQLFINVYKEIYRLALIAAGTGMRSHSDIDKTTPSVFILGFTKSNIIRELLKFPEFGFLSIQERDELDKLQRLANLGLPSDVKRYKEFYGILKRRITTKKTGGFYKFYGYQELVNRLFISDEVNLIDLETIATQRMKIAAAKKKDEQIKKRKIQKDESLNQQSEELDDKKDENLTDKKDESLNHQDENLTDKKDENFSKQQNTELTEEEIAEISINEGSTLEEIIKEYINNGKIRINKELLDQFNNSLIICDEVHNIYNSFMKNNYGVAIQYILDYNPNVRAVFMSATPMNNSPTEIVDVINLLVPSKSKITKSDLFVSGKQLKDNALDTIENLCFGHISFIQDLNPRYMPAAKFMGTQCVLNSPVKYSSTSAFGGIGTIERIPYLVFEQCEMSEEHCSAYIKYLEETDQLGGVSSASNYSSYSGLSNDTNYSSYSGLSNDTNFSSYPKEQTKGYTIGTESRAIFDLIYPTGVFKTSDLKKLQTTDEQTLQKAGVKIVKSSSSVYTIAGDWLKYENIGKYSAKYKKLLDNIFRVFAEIRKELETGKAPPETYGRKHMIYHDKVRNSGVLQIQELLKANGFIDEKSEAVDTTLCSICGIEFSKHSGHKFYPARFVMAHSDIDKKIIENSIIKYNAPENTYGIEYWGLIGSQLISEGYDMKDVREFSIMSSPVNISTLKQTLGRCVRKNSHINLMPHQRNVNISLYICTMPRKYGINTPDEYRYVDKLTDYYFIQNIENRMHKAAVDGDLHFDIISRGMPPYGDYSNIMSRDLGPIPYRPLLELPDLTLFDLQTITFDAYGYNLQEIKTCVYIIKRLFLLRPVWKYDELWSAVRLPPFGIEANPTLFSEKNFIIALNGLISKTKVFMSGQTENILSKTHKDISQKILANTLFDRNDKYIYGFGDIFDVNLEEKTVAEPAFAEKLGGFLGSEKYLKKGSSEESEPNTKWSYEHIHPLPFGKKYKIEHIGEYYILFPVEPVSFGANTSMSISEKVIIKKRTALTTIAEHDEEIPLIDIESYIRPVAEENNVIIDIEDYMATMKNTFAYELQYARFVKQYIEANVVPYVDIVGEHTPEFFQNLLSDIIASGVENAIAGKSHPPAKKRVYAEILNIFDKFKAIYYLSDILGNDEVARRITDTRIINQTETGKITSPLPKNTPIGFLGKTAIYIYGESAEIAEKTGEYMKQSDLLQHKEYKSGWIRIGKNTLGVNKNYTENANYIGYYEESSDGSMKFKIRKGISASETKKSSIDIRFVERGIVCSSKSKKEIIAVINSLGLNIDKEIKNLIKSGKYPNPTDENGNPKIKYLCKILELFFIEEEIKQRQKGTTIKYMYMWYEDPLSIGHKV